MIENFIQNLTGFADTVSMIVQYFIHGVGSFIHFIRSLFQAVIFVFEAITFLPVWFGVVVSVVVSVLIIKLIIPGGD